MSLKRLVYESKPVPTLVMLIVTLCVDRMVYTQILCDRTKFFLYFANIVVPIVSIAVSGSIAIYKVYVKGSTPADTPRLPHYRYTLMALLSTLYSLLSVVPTPHIGGYVADVLSELSLPFIMVLSYMVLSTGFKHGHELGLLLVLYGTIINIIPQLRKEQPSDLRSDWLRLYAISITQQALFAHSAFKQMGLKDVDSGFWITNPWISFYQILWGLASLYILNPSAMSWSDLLAFVCEMCDYVFGKYYLSCDSGIFGCLMLFALYHVNMNNVPVTALKISHASVDVITFAMGLPLTYTMYSLPASASYLGLATFSDLIVMVGFNCAVLCVKP